jgi:cystathionine gamma-synthase
VRGTALEVPDNIVRLSVGIEDVDDLIADIDQAIPKKVNRALQKK